MHDNLPGIGIFGGSPDTVKILAQILRQQGFNIQAIWFKTMKEAEEASRELKINFYTNKIDDVLLCKNVDLIFVMCEPLLHPQITVKSLGIGKHVVCDRPCGINKEDARKMCRSSEYYPSLISLVNHSLRFLPAYVHLRKSIHDGTIGALSLIDVNVKVSSLLSENYNWLCSDDGGGGEFNIRFIQKHSITTLELHF